MKYTFPADITKLPYYMTIVNKRHSGYKTGVLKSGDPGFFKAQTNYGIALPIPDNLQDSTSASWVDMNDKSATGQILEAGIEKSATAARVKQEATFQIGKALEKHSSMIFDGMNVKTYSFAWDLIPDNAQEASQIESIITELEIAQLPSIDGDYMQFPDLFYISFTGVRLKLAPCVLTDISVNYAPSGKFTAMSDGYLPGYNLSLSFTEITSRNRQIYQHLYH